MIELTHKELEDVIKVAYRKKRAYFIWGATGIGKSYTIRKLAKELAKEEGKELIEWNGITKKRKLEILENPSKYFLFIDQRATQFDLGDFKLPKFDNMNGTFEWCIPLVYQVICSPDASGILFFDEFNLSPPSIQSMFYSIINDKEIGEHKISDNIFVIGAGNRTEDKASVYEMGSPLLDRFEHIVLNIPSIDSWSKWAIKNDIDVRIITFLKFKPSFLFKFDSDSKEKAFPTPRGWEYCSRMIEGIRDNDSLIENIVTSNVGKGVSMEMMSFLRLSEKININEILNNPDLVNSLEGEDLKWSLVSELVEVYKKDKFKLEDISRVLARIEPEFTIMCLRLMKGYHKAYFTRMIKKYEGLKKFVKYLLEDV